MVLERVHVVAAVLFVVAIVVQVFLAGAAMANLGGSGNFGSHIEFGYTGMGIAVLVLLVTALVARRPRRDVGIVVALLVLYIVQTVLPNFRTSSPALAALHRSTRCCCSAWRRGTPAGRGRRRWADATHAARSAHVRATSPSTRP